MNKSVDLSSSLATPFQNITLCASCIDQSHYKVCKIALPVLNMVFWNQTKVICA